MGQGFTEPQMRQDKAVPLDSQGGAVSLLVPLGWGSVLLRPLGGTMSPTNFPGQDPVPSVSPRQGKTFRFPGQDYVYSPAGREPGPPPGQPQ